MSVVEFVPFLQLISAVVPWTHHVGPFYHLRGILLHPWKQGSNPRKQLLRQTSPSSVTAELPFSSREAGGSAGGWTRNQAGSMGPPWILGIPGKAERLCASQQGHTLVHVVDPEADVFRVMAVMIPPAVIVLRGQPAGGSARLLCWKDFRDDSPK